MKRAVLAILTTVAGLVFIFSYRPPQVTAESPPIVITAPDKPDQPKYPKFPGKKVTVDYDLAGRDLNLAGLADGTYVGDAVEIPGGHGPLQVSVTVVDGAVADLQTAHQPTSTHSEQISGRALPLLREEVLTTGQVPVDAVSGATAASQAFGESLLGAVG